MMFEDIEMLMIAPVIVKWVIWISAVVTSGGLLATVMFNLPSLRRLQVAFAIIGAGGCILSFGVAGAVLMGTWDGILMPGIAALLWGGGSGPWLTATALVFLTGVHVSRTAWINLLKAVLLLFCLTMLSHLSGLMKALLFIHLFVAVTWAGVVLPFLLCDRAEQLRHSATLFGRWAPVILGVLAVCGGGLVLLKTQGDVFLLLQSDWGWALLAKLGFVGTAALIGLCNKVKIVPNLQDEQERGFRVFRGLMQVDILVFMVIVLISAWLSSGATLG
ncbi:CopD family protein [Halocynthiibacter namhaensis]|uniref:CopD family protein n=1 Tax=Halocynthiibacter namhaensis TaxID=1290553 RepID=UPI0009DD40BA|nr:CopD family protein [Halocynthiibacter namhaensis]